MANREKYIFTDSFLNNYIELEPFGEGGNALVFKAKDDNGNVVAIKLLTKAASKDKIQRFKNEMYFGTQNKHENIIQVIANGIFNYQGKECIFYVMPFYGETLRSLMEKGIDNKRVLFLFNQLLNGMIYVHSKGIFHRDIKPENILYDSKLDKLIIADFGIAHFEEAELYTAIETKDNDRLANFQYAAPEQRIKGSTVNKEADIYALGLILNEMFTKRIPFGAAYKKISDCNTNFSFLDEVVDMMLQQDFDKRVQSLEIIQQEIKARVDYINSQEEISKLESITLSLPDEDDPIIINPPKLIAFNYNESTQQLELTLSQSVNQKWVHQIRTQSHSFLRYFGVERFNFTGNTTTVEVDFESIESIQEIIRLFKIWVNDANRNYHNVITREREIEQRRKEQQLQEEIVRKKRLQEIIKNINM